MEKKWRNSPDTNVSSLLKPVFQKRVKNKAPEAKQTASRPPPPPFPRTAAGRSARVTASRGAEREHGTLSALITESVQNPRWSYQNPQEVSRLPLHALPRCVHTYIHAFIFLERNELRCPARGGGPAEAARRVPAVLGAISPSSAGQLDGAAGQHGVKPGDEGARDTAERARGAEWKGEKEKKKKPREGRSTNDETREGLFPFISSTSFPPPPKENKLRIRKSELRDRCCRFVFPSFSPVFFSPFS